MSNESISVSLGDGIDFKIICAGSFFDKKKNETIEYGDSIKLKKGDDEFKLSAIAAARLYHALRDPDIKQILQDRFLVEMQELQETEGF